MPAKMRREWVDDWVPLLPAEGLSRQENGAGSGPAPSIPNPGARLARCRCAAGGLGDDRAVDGGGRLPVVTAAKQRNAIEQQDGDDNRGNGGDDAGRARKRVLRVTSVRRGLGRGFHVD